MLRRSPSKRRKQITTTVKGKATLYLILLALLALLSSLTATIAGAAQPVDPPGRSQPAADQADRLIVKFKPGTDANVAAEVHRQNDAVQTDAIPEIEAQVVSLPAGAAQARGAAYAHNPNVLYAEPDYIATTLAAVMPNDPGMNSPSPQQWGMFQVQAPDAWGVTTGSTSVRIAILDTGIDQNHEDLQGKIVSQKNLTSSGTVDDQYGHGTHVAGIAAAVTNNEKGVAGLGFNSRLMNGKVMGDTGRGYYSWIAKGLIWAADNGAKVINMSLGGPNGSSALQEAVEYAWKKGAVVVAAAGNSGLSTQFYPAAYNNVMAVAATDMADRRTSWSTYGSWVDVSAPGAGIYSTLPNHQNAIGSTNYGSLSGTSMASPHVAGLAALLWSTGYGSGNLAVRGRIESTTDQVATDAAVHGRINAARAVAQR